MLYLKTSIVDNPLRLGLLLNNMSDQATPQEQNKKLEQNDFEYLLGLLTLKLACDGDALMCFTYFCFAKQVLLDFWFDF